MSDKKSNLLGRMKNLLTGSSSSKPPDDETDPYCPWDHRMDHDEHSDYLYHAREYNDRDFKHLLEKRAKPAPLPPLPEPSAKLYRLQVDELPDGAPVNHTILSIPKNIFLMDRREKMRDENVRQHTSYNMVMIEAGRRVGPFFEKIVEQWRIHIVPVLDGETDCCRYSSEAMFSRTDRAINNYEYQGYSANLASAIKYVGERIHQCPQRHVRVFFISSGYHDANYKDPFLSIKNIYKPQRRRVELYFLALMPEFPVDLALALRYKINTGSTSIPPLFWAKEVKDVSAAMEKMSRELRTSDFLRLNMAVDVFANAYDARKEVFSGELLLINKDPETVLSTVKLVEKKELVVESRRNWRDSRYREDNRHHLMRMDMPRHERKLRYGRRRFEDDGYPDSDSYDEDDEDYMYYRMQRSGSKERKTPKKEQKLLPLESKIEETDMNFLLDVLFPLWCSILKQRHRSGSTVSMAIFDLMHKIFNIHLKKVEAMEDNAQLDEKNPSKNLEDWKTKFRELMKESYDIIKVEMYFESEKIEMKRHLLTTVECKNDLQLLKMKGFSGNAWGGAVADFKEKYLAIESQIKAMPEPTTEECCKISQSSFLKDLQKDDFMKILQKKRAEFLKEFCFTGIPVHSPVTVGSRMNPWTLIMKNVCKPPFAIMSSKGMEMQRAKERIPNFSLDKELKVEEYNKDTVYNIIIPTVPHEYAELLKPLVRSDVFAGACTFSILKSAQIIDRNCHLAALGCVWMKMITVFPAHTRTLEARKVIADIEATALLYLDRRSHRNYIDALLRAPQFTVATESPIGHNDMPIKSESIVKPAFLFLLQRNNLPLLWECRNNIPLLVVRILAEFVGRCLSSYKSLTPYVDFYLPPVPNEDGREGWLKEKAQQIFAKLNVTGKELLETYYTPASLRKKMLPIIKKAMQESKHEMQWFHLFEHDMNMVDRTLVYKYEYPVAINDDPEDAMEEDGGYDTTSFIVPKLNLEKINKLRKTTSAGHVSFDNLRHWLNEIHMWYSRHHAEGATARGEQERPICLNEEDIHWAIGYDMMNVYLAHALKYRSSRDRANNPMPSPEETKAEIPKKLEKEWGPFLAKRLQPKIEELLLDCWLEEYRRVHDEIALPLSIDQLIYRARRLGVEVSYANFYKVYRNYDVNTKLSRNSCQNELCPHFLMPMKDFNGHVEVERIRQKPNYLHALHLNLVNPGDTTTMRLAMNIVHGYNTGSCNRERNLMRNHSTSRIIPHIEAILEKNKLASGPFREDLEVIRNNTISEEEACSGTLPSGAGSETN